MNIRRHKYVETILLTKQTVWVMQFDTAYNRLW